MFHCHILWDHAGGMLMAFQVMGSEEGVFRGERGEERGCGKVLWCWGIENWPENGQSDGL